MIQNRRLSMLGKEGHFGIMEAGSRGKGPLETHRTSQHFGIGG